jgi:hypothetical protein
MTFRLYLFPFFKRKEKRKKAKVSVFHKKTKIPKKNGDGPD